MKPLARFGTRTLAFFTMTALAACGDSRGGTASELADAGSLLDASDAATTGDGATAACSAHSDCELVSEACCSCPPGMLSSLRAVTHAEADGLTRRCDGIVCGPCEIKPYDPLAPVYRAACVEQRCTVIDLREASRCTSDSDCAVEGATCCPSCTDDASQFVALSRDVDRSVLACFPIPTCAPCTSQATPPSAFCAPDKRCAVRPVERVGGVISTTCFSPNQQLDMAYTAGAQGCDCELGSSGVCVPDATGRRVALLCEEDGRWHAVEDGPCAPTR